MLQFHHLLPPLASCHTREERGGGGGNRPTSNSGEWVRMISKAPDSLFIKIYFIEGEKVSCIAQSKKEFIVYE